MFTLGAENFLNDSKWEKKLRHKKVAYLGNATSVSTTGELILDDLLKYKNINIQAIFSPQHGFYGTQQANMRTTDDGTFRGLPLISLYSEKTRRLTPKTAALFDVLLIDLQDVGCRIYTYLTTLFYMIEDCEKYNKSIIVLDRPNPVGRKIEGNFLDPNFKSFVGAAIMPMRHGFTLGEAALWYKQTHKIKVDLEVSFMKSYFPDKNPWPARMPWINPSPNITSIDCCRCYPGTVLLEGTTLSEGRGTTKPLETVGYPKINITKIKQFMEGYGKSFLQGTFLRETQFKPTFNKFTNEVCNGIEIHLDPFLVKGRGPFRSYRLICLFLKAFHNIYPDQKIWIDPPYEYEEVKMPIDIISGNEKLRQWVEDSSSSVISVSEWDEYLRTDEQKWEKERKEFLVYKSGFFC